MKGRWVLLALTFAVVPVGIAETMPSPELLELLGIITELEEIGLDLEQEIEQRLLAAPPEAQESHTQEASQ